MTAEWLNIETFANFLRELTLFILLIGAVYSDLFYSRIFNWLTLPAMAFGLVLAFGLHGLAGDPGGLLDHLVAAVVASGVFAIPYCLGWFGAGDVKLLAAVGALEGLQFTMAAMLFTGLAGGILVLGFFLFRPRRAEGNAGEIQPPSETARPSFALFGHLPYGAAIAAGSMTAWFQSILG